MKKIINPWIGIEGYNCFGCSPDNKIGLKMEFYEDGDEIVSFWTPESDFQGWLNTLHGGIQATLMDEIGAWVLARKLQTTGVTCRADIRYKKSISTFDTRITIRASLKETKRHLAIVEARLYNAAGELCSTSEIVYACFSPERAKEETFFEHCNVEEQEIEQ